MESIKYNCRWLSTLATTQPL